MPQLIETFLSLSWMNPSLLQLIYTFGAVAAWYIATLSLKKKTIHLDEKATKIAVAIFFTAGCKDFLSTGVSNKKGILVFLDIVVAILVAVLAFTKSFSSEKKNDKGGENDANK